MKYVVPPEKLADRGTFTEKQFEMTNNLALNKHASVKG